MVVTKSRSRSQAIRHRSRARAQLSPLLENACSPIAKTAQFSPHRQLPHLFLALSPYCPTPAQLLSQRLHYRRSLPPDRDSHDFPTSSPGLVPISTNPASNSGPVPILGSSGVCTVPPPPPSPSSSTQSLHGTCSTLGRHYLRSSLLCTRLSSLPSQRSVLYRSSSDCRSQHGRCPLPPSSKSILLQQHATSCVRRLSSWSSCWCGSAAVSPEMGQLTAVDTDTEDGADTECPTVVHI